MTEGYIDSNKISTIARLVHGMEDNAADAIFLLLAVIKIIDAANRKQDSTRPLTEIVVEMLNCLEEETVQ